MSWARALAPGHDPDAVRDAAERILADDRYDPPSRSILDRVLGWVAERLEGLFSVLAGGGGWLSQLLAWALLGAAAAVIAYVVARNARLGPIRAPRAERPEVMVETTRTPEEWLAEAAALEADGRWAEGLRCRHRALVGELVRRGVIPEQAGRTTGEHVGDVRRGLPEAAPAFAAATELFEAVWYGGATAGPAEADRFAGLADRVRVPRAAAVTA
ncbi:MAG: DUF4129 domain-containing protein [Acidimicrobiia bacterium]